MQCVLQPIRRFALEGPSKESNASKGAWAQLSLLLPDIPLFGQQQPAVATVIATGEDGQVMNAVSTCLMSCVL